MPGTRITGQIDRSLETKQEICRAWNVHALLSLGLHEAHVPRQDGCEAIGLTGETDDQNRDGGIRALKLLGDSMPLYGCPVVLGDLQVCCLEPRICVRYIGCWTDLLLLL